MGLSILFVMNEVDLEKTFYLNFDHVQERLCLKNNKKYFCPCAGTACTITLILGSFSNYQIEGLIVQVDSAKLNRYRIFYLRVSIVTFCQVPMQTADYIKHPRWRCIFKFSLAS